MTETENKNWAFLCFSQQDNRAHRSEAPTADNLCWGDWLHAALKAFSVPAEFIGQINGRGEIIPKRIEAIFRDETELPESATLSAETRTALEQSICLIAVCSPRSAKSLHVNEAVRYFKQLGRSQQILPIVIAGEPNVSERDATREDECFVPALRHPVLPDGTIDLTRRAGNSIFVDARHNGREILAKDTRLAEADLEMAKIQLIALLLGVGFNGLWWREQKRHFLDLAEARVQMREARSQVAEVQVQLQAAQQQMRVAQNQALENQNLPREVQGQIQEAQTQARHAEDQARETQKQLQEFQSKVRETQSQLEEARNRALAAESKVLEAQNQARETLNQLEAARMQARATQNTDSQLEELQNQSRSAQSELESARQLVHEAQNKVLAAQQQAREAQNQVQEIQNLTRDAQGQIKAAQDQVQKIQSQSRNARRLNRALAVLAVLALLAAGLAANLALRQRKVAGALNQEPIALALRKLDGVEQARSLNQLAASIPQSEIPEALKASSVILNDQLRSHFQKWLLIRLSWVNPVSAMTNAGAIEGKMVTDAGLSDAARYLQLAVLDNWMQTDFPGALNWVKSQTDSESKDQMLTACIRELAKTDVRGALALAEALPESDWRSAMISTLAGQIDLSAALQWIYSQDVLPETLVPFPWTNFLLTLNFGSPTNSPLETEVLSDTPNDPMQNK